MNPISFKRHRFPADVIRHAVWLYFRFTLSFRDVEELLAQRGIEVSYETVRCWTLKFGPQIAANLRRRVDQPSEPRPIVSGRRRPPRPDLRLGRGSSRPGRVKLTTPRAERVAVAGPTRRLRRLGLRARLGRPRSRPSSPAEVNSSSARAEVDGRRDRSAEQILFVAPGRRQWLSVIVEREYSSSRAGGR